MASLVDTSALVAIADADEPEHSRLLAFVLATKEALVVSCDRSSGGGLRYINALGAHVALAMLRSIASSEFQMEARHPPIWLGLLS